MLKRFAELLSGPPRNTQTAEWQRVQLATCVILLEAASADNEFTGEERSHILQVMKQRFAITDEESEELLRDAMAARNESTDLFRFTARINEEFTPAEKIEILEEVWRIIYSDGTLNAHEDHLAHKLRNLLNLNHPQMIEAKMKVLKEVRS